MDLTAQLAPHTCVLVSSPNKIRDLFKEHSHLHESNDGSSVFSDSAHTRCQSATHDPVTGVLRMSEQDAQSHTRCAHPHTLFFADKTLTALVQWSGAPRMQPLARWHECCERSQGEHLPHRTVARTATKWEMPAPLHLQKPCRQWF